MYKHSITGAGSLQRAIEWTRWLKSNGYEHKRDWDWLYRPSQQNEYKQIDFYFRDESLLTLVLLKEPERDR